MPKLSKETLAFAQHDLLLVLERREAQRVPRLERRLGGCLEARRLGLLGSDFEPGSDDKG